MQCEPERAHTHVTHWMRVRTQITWTWLCTRGEKRYKYCSFSHTNHSFRVLGHQCVVTMGNCLILISLCMFFFPLIETVTYTCHYMTDRLERFDLKTSKLDLLKKKRHLHLGCPWGKLIDTNFYFKVNYPFKSLRNQAPQYLSELLHPPSQSRLLRSRDSDLLYVPRTRLKNRGDRAFAVIGHKLWNSLPAYIRSTQSLSTFKSALKTYLFSVAFNIP